MHARPNRNGADPAAPEGARAALEAVWRIESARIIGALTRMVGDVDRAEDFAQEALVAALVRWPESGVPDNPGAWLMTAAKRRAVDHLRRAGRLDRKHAQLARELEAEEKAGADPAAGIGDPVGDDVLRLFFLCCHPVLSAEARVALARRLSSVLEVVYLIFNEGYAATSGDDWFRPRLCHEAIRLGQILAELAPDEPEVHGLVSLVEIQASRLPARLGPSGEPVLLLDQNRGRWDRLLVRRGLTALSRAPALGGPLGPYPPGGDRRLPRSGPFGGRDGLEADRRPLRRARALSRGRAEPRGRRGDGIRPGGRACAPRGERVGGNARRLPPPSGGPGPPARAAGAPGRGPGGVRGGRRAHRKRRGGAGAPGAGAEVWGRRHLLKEAAEAPTGRAAS